MTTQQKCTICGVEKPHTHDFYSYSKKPVLQRRCKTCCNEIAKKYEKERPKRDRKEEQKAYYEKNKEKKKAYYEKNKEKIRLQKIEYRRKKRLLKEQAKELLAIQS